MFDDAPLGAPDLPPEGSSVQEEAARAAAAAAALIGVAGTSGKQDLTGIPHSDDSDDDGMDHYGGAPSPMHRYALIIDIDFGSNIINIMKVCFLLIISKSLNSRRYPKVLSIDFTKCAYFEFILRFEYRLSSSCK